MFRMLGTGPRVDSEPVYDQRAPAPLAIAIDANAARTTAQRM
jgi:hypothetical protein